MSVKPLPKPRKPRALVRIKKTKKLQPPAKIRNEPITADMTEKEKRAYYNLCGEPEERKKIVDRFSELLKAEPAITLPEAIFYWELEKRQLKFYYQSSIDGGRAELGGMVVDFIVEINGEGLGVLVNGDFWHSTPIQRERDLDTLVRVIGMTYQGLLITYSVEVWESALMSCAREDVVDRTLRGENVGRM